MHSYGGRFLEIFKMNVRVSASKCINVVKKDSGGRFQNLPLGAHVKHTDIQTDTDVEQTNNATDISHRARSHSKMQPYSLRFCVVDRSGSAAVTLPVAEEAQPSPSQLQR